MARCGLFPCYCISFNWSWNKRSEVAENHNIISLVEKNPFISLMFPQKAKALDDCTNSILRLQVDWMMVSGLHTVRRIGGWKQDKDLFSTHNRSGVNRQGKTSMDPEHRDARLIQERDSRMQHLGICLSPDIEDYGTDSFLSFASTFYS